MKSLIFPFLAFASACGAPAADRNPGDTAPAYVSEAPLPEGWPKPGPYNEVSVKTYPPYRAASIKGNGETLAFWTLFTHIKRKGIPMTAPVEKSMAGGDGKLRQTSMSFLYRNPGVGATGNNGGKVEVRNLPASRVLSYTWQGEDSQTAISKANSVLEAALKSRGAKSKQFRLLGYNGPDTPPAKRTWELQALLD